MTETSKSFWRLTQRASSSRRCRPRRRWHQVLGERLSPNPGSAVFAAFRPDDCNRISFIEREDHMAGRSGLTVADLELMPEDLNRYEVIEGDLFVSGPPDLPHQLVVSNCLIRIGSYLDRVPIGFLVPGPGVILDQTNGVIPDVIFIGNKRRLEIAKGDMVSGAPDLVIEVLSPGADNERRDR